MDLSGILDILTAIWEAISSLFQGSLDLQSIWDTISGLFS